MESKDKENVPKESNNNQEADEQEILNLLKKVERDQILADLKDLQINPNENIEKNSDSENSDEENENVKGMRLRNGKRTVTFSQ